MSSSIGSTEEEFPTSLKSTHSRVGSAKSQKSVMWSTRTTSDIGSELGLIEMQEEENKEEKRNRCLEIISGKNFPSFYLKYDNLYCLSLIAKIKPFKVCGLLARCWRITQISSFMWKSPCESWFSTVVFFL